MNVFTQAESHWLFWPALVTVVLVNTTLLTYVVLRRPSRLRNAWRRRQSRPSVSLFKYDATFDARVDGAYTAQIYHRFVGDHR